MAEVDYRYCLNPIPDLGVRPVEITRGPHKTFNAQIHGLSGHGFDKFQSSSFGEISGVQNPKIVGPCSGFWAFLVRFGVAHGGADKLL